MAGGLIAVAIAAPQVALASSQVGKSTSETGNGVACGWNLKENGSHGLNAGWPDNDASYWYAEYATVPGGRMIIHGDYAKARFFVIDVYDVKANPYNPDLLDVALRPDPGSVNPYRVQKAADHQSYTAYVDFEPPPAHPASNTDYVGNTVDGTTPNPGGLLIMRVYLPNDPTSDTGSVPLPSLSLQLPGQQPIPLKSCSAPGTLPSQPLLLKTISGLPPTGSAPFPLASNPPKWTASNNPNLNNALASTTPAPSGYTPTGIGLLTTPGNSYIGARISSQYGQDFVLRAKAPTSPNTRAGQWVGTPTQLRYWSVCEFSTATGQTVACLPDHDIKLDRYGYFTVVISTEADRPRNGINWLPIGDPYEGWPTIRQALPSPSFAQAIENVPKQANLAEAMGPYFPVSGYCSTKAFETHGAACL